MRSCKVTDPTVPCKTDVKRLLKYNLGLLPGLFPPYSWELVVLLFLAIRSAHFKASECGRLPKKNDCLYCLKLGKITCLWLLVCGNNWKQT